MRNKVIRGQYKPGPKLSFPGINGLVVNAQHPLQPAVTAVRPSPAIQQLCFQILYECILFTSKDGMFHFSEKNSLNFSGSVQFVKIILTFTALVTSVAVICKFYKCTFCSLRQTGKKEN